MMAGKGCVVRSKVAEVSKNPGGQGGVEIMKDDVWMGSGTGNRSDDYCKD